ncbi:amidohydrolase family protein [Nonomuraea sp. NPDC050783]|uniref:amidohydrolase family protein n=1 Tax=Nonomuraea sp. NPDC050783 TaxID=3154634 RepID=UPI0034658CCD
MFTSRATPAHATDGTGVLAVAGATVIDGTDGPPARDQTIVMAGGLIIWSGPSAQAVVPHGATVVNARGTFVIPGLWDMHTHMTATDERVYPPLYLAHGVTGIREMWGDPTLYALRTRIEAGALLGPRIVTAGSIVDGVPSVWPDATQVASPEEGRAAVRATAAEGAEFVKVYSHLGDDIFGAILDEARRHDLPVAGHLPWRVGAGRASDAGMHSMEHLFGLPTAVSAREEEIRRTLAETPIDPADPRRYYDLARELDRQASLSHVPAKAARLFERLARNNTWQSPTLRILSVASSPADTFADDPRLKYVPQDVRAYWRERLGELAPSTPKQIAEQSAFLRYRMDMVAEMHAAGVSIIGGTDTPNPYVFPGSGVHDELALLVRAGLSPGQALRSMTSEAARCLGLQDLVGTLAAGKAADLLVLDADPLRDIRNTQKIRSVVVRGRLLDRRRLDDMLAGVEAAVAAPATAPSRLAGRPACC